MNQQDRDILEDLVKYNKERIEELEKYYKTLNREMGEVLGELRWMKWLLCSALGGIIIQLTIKIFGG